MRDRHPPRAAPVTGSAWGEGPSHERPLPDEPPSPAEVPSPDDRPLPADVLPVPPIVDDAVGAPDSRVVAADRVTPLEIGPHSEPGEPGPSGLSDDPLAVVAMVVGVIGLVVAGIALAVLTAILAAEAGRQAREARRPQRYGLWALGLAVLDAVVWLVLHVALDLKFAVG